jgi:telomerase reverse transcriptase
MVSAFCRAVLSRLIPSDFWGTRDTKTHNEKVFLQSVDRFIELRRFESLSLHRVSQGLKVSFHELSRIGSDIFQIAEIEWLGPPNAAGHKLSQTDTNKRWEIFQEFLYYVFDSILIPLIRANFHVTESIHKNRLFYFRHDVWRSLAEPALAKLKESMFEEVKLEKARKILESRSLGYTQVRLQPKVTGVRPIMNLKRRSIRKGQKTLGPSINSILAPVYNVFTFESVS